MTSSDKMRSFVQAVKGENDDGLTPNENREQELVSITKSQAISIDSSKLEELDLDNESPNMYEEYDETRETGKINSNVYGIYFKR